MPKRTNILKRSLVTGAEVWKEKRCKISATMQIPSTVSSTFTEEKAKTNPDKNYGINNRSMELVSGDERKQNSFEVKAKEMESSTTSSSNPNFLSKMEESRGTKVTSKEFCRPPTSKKVERRDITLCLERIGSGKYQFKSSIEKRTRSPWPCDNKSVQPKLFPSSKRKQLGNILSVRKACPECDKVMMNLIELLIHLKEKRKEIERPFSCQWRDCQRVFVEKKEAYIHYELDHLPRSIFC